MMTSAMGNVIGSSTLDGVHYINKEKFTETNRVTYLGFFFLFVMIWIIGVDMFYAGKFLIFDSSIHRNRHN